MKRLLILFLIATLAPACLMIPLSSDHGEEIEKVQKQIAIGSTTKEEVISILGPPDVTRERFILYKNKEYSGGALWMIILPPSGAGGTAGQVYMDLYFEFDNYGVLIDFRSDKYDVQLNNVD